MFLNTAKEFLLHDTESKERLCRNVSTSTFTTEKHKYLHFSITYISGYIFKTFSNTTWCLFCVHDRNEDINEIWVQTCSSQKLQTGTVSSNDWSGSDPAATAAAVRLLNCDTLKQVVACDVDSCRLITCILANTPECIKSVLLPAQPQLRRCMRWRCWTGAASKGFLGQGSGLHAPLRCSKEQVFSWWSLFLFFSSYHLLLLQLNDVCIWFQLWVLILLLYNSTHIF